MLKKTKRIISIILALVMLITSAPMVASAATNLSLFDGGLTITDTNGSGSASGTTVTITTTGSFLTTASNTITITNSSGTTKKLSFNYAVSGTGVSSHTMGATSGTVEQTMAAGDTLSYTFVAKALRKTAILTMSNITFADVGSSGSITVNYDSALGSVTLNGSVVASGEKVDGLSASESSTLVATANSGVTFLGWLNTNNHTIVSTATTYSCIAGDNTVLEAVFTNQNSKPYWQVGGYVFGDLNDAITAAGTSGTIILLNDATLPAGNYTIPSGVTLAIPFNDAHTIYTGEPETEYETGNTTSNHYVAPTLYRTLKMASGANIVVNGIMTLPTKLFAGSGSTYGAGSPFGSYSVVDMAQGSSITVNNGATLTCYSFITGDGTVTAKSGATINETFQINDFRGGNGTTAMTDSGKGVFPFSAYYVQNIEAPLTLEAGAVEYAYTAIRMSGFSFCEAIDFIGSSSSSAMFRINSGYVTKEYDPTTDRLEIKSYGDLSLSPIEASIGNFIAKVDINSADYELPINHNISIVLENGSTATVNQDIAMLPGSELTVKEGATCTLGSGNNIYLYDLDQWGNYVGPYNGYVPHLALSPTRAHTFSASDMKDAKVVVDGTINALNGYVYSTTGGANVTGNGIVKINPGSQTETYQFTYTGTASDYGTYTAIPLTPVKLLNSDSTFLDTSVCLNAYTTNDNGMWECLYIEGETPGHVWDNGTTTAATCTQNGVTTYGCTICTATKTETIAATGHNYTSVVTPVTCTTDGYTTHTCSNCSDSYVTDQVTATGHSYTSTVVAPTENAKGYTEHTCSNCGDTYKDNETGYASDDSALVAAIASANSLIAEDYSTESYTALQTLCTQHASLASGTNSQNELDTATQEILSAINALEPYLNLSVKATNGTVTVVFDETTGNAGKYSMMFGTEVTLTATANDGYIFDGWYETTTMRIFSTDATYAFPITSNTDFEARFVKENGATLTFTNKTGQIVATIDKTVSEWATVTTIADLLPDVPYSYGFTNGRWVYDDATVIASLQSGTDVTVIPEYDATDIENPVIPTPAGDTPVLDLYYSYNEDASKGTFLMATGIPEGCQIESIGVAFYYKTADQFDPTTFTLTLTNKMTTSKFTDVKEDNTYIVNVGEGFLAKYNWAAKGYVTYYNADGKLVTAYTNQINLNGIDQIV